MTINLFFSFPTKAPYVNAKKKEKNRNIFLSGRMRGGGKVVNKVLIVILSCCYLNWFIPKNQVLQYPKSCYRVCGGSCAEQMVKKVTGQECSTTNLKLG